MTIKSKENSFPSILRVAHDAIIITDQDQNILFFNQSAEMLFGYKAGEIVGKKLDVLLPSSLTEIHNLHFKKFAKGRKVSQRMNEKREVFGRHKNGKVFPAEAAISRFKEEDVTFFSVTLRDITDSKQAENQLRLVTERFKLSTNAARIGVWDLDLQTNQTYWDDRQFEIYGLQREKTGVINYETWVERVHPDDLPNVEVKPDQEFPTESSQFEFRIIRPDGALRYIRAAEAVVRDEKGNPVRLVGVNMDITEEKEAEEKNIQLYQQANRRLKQVQALRLIDTAITSIAEIGFILDIAIEQVILQLEIDAAAILLIDPSTSMLKYTAGYGFYGTGIKQSNLHSGEGFAGQSAQQRKLVIVPDLTAEKTNFSRASLLKDENFIFYASRPIVFKGQVKGVLEVFKRSHHTPEAEWQDFFAALAGQISIAIDNTTLFTNLQRSNADVITAYDETLEGWSRAMDFRDKETEGHTQRVTEIALKLAQALGVDNEQLIHIRRGGLLHDIGKVGVPDNILLKAGPLTPDEWEIMRQHPEIAYKMLSPIQFLKQALDIPYCHHEKWDGSGYPRALKGEQIPLSARIFAVADVWDALRSDRPYRKGWPVEKVIEHFRSVSGSHFDPSVLKIFLDLIQSKEWGEEIIFYQP